jgi:hypothetical protein
MRRHRTRSCDAGQRERRCKTSVAGYTSHVTRHTSHITRHTSHFTRTVCHRPSRILPRWVPRSLAAVASTPAQYTTKKQKTNRVLLHLTLRHVGNNSTPCCIPAQNVTIIHCGKTGHLRIKRLDHRRPQNDLPVHAAAAASVTRHVRATQRTHDITCKPRHLHSMEPPLTGAKHEAPEL